MRHTKFICGIVFAGCAALPFAIGPAVAAPPAEEELNWDVSAPPGLKVHQVSIDVTEGSWMNLDVSPDGKTIAFDLLGDIYTMSISGGIPKRIAEGLPYETQPRFSPDGKRIAFTSDRGGGDNIWIMNADGSDKRQVTKEDFRLLNQPSWSPDGRFIVAKKHFTTGRSLGTGEVWLYHVSGGNGVALVKKPNEQHQKELGEPIYAPDGKHIYFTRNVTPGPIFQYAQDSNTQLFDIERYDLDTGEIEPIVTGAGGSVRPSPSPDGKMIAFVRRERTKSKLYIKDLATGEERKVYDALDQDVQETWAVTGVYPNMDWTPDSASIVFWAGGKIRKLDVAVGRLSDIPFHVADTRDMIDPPRPPIDVAPAQFQTKMPRGVAVSPDGRSVVFETLGKLWIKPMAGGAPKRLTKVADSMEAYPSWSRDGKSIVYVSWTDSDLGQIRVVVADRLDHRALDRVAHQVDHLGGRLHAAQRGLLQAVAAGQHLAHHLVEVLQRRGLDAVERGDAGVVDEHADAEVAVQRVGDLGDRALQQVLDQPALEPHVAGQRLVLAVLAPRLGQALELRVGGVTPGGDEVLADRLHLGQRQREHAGARDLLELRVVGEGTVSEETEHEASEVRLRSAGREEGRDARLRKALLAGDGIGEEIDRAAARRSDQAAAALAQSARDRRSRTDPPLPGLTVVGAG